MKKVCAVAILVSGALFLCATITIGGEEALPKAEGKAFYDYITTTSPYDQWPLFPGTEKLYEGKHPHGAFLTTYVNNVALKGINDKVGTLANGAIVVKENYTPEKELAAVTIMYRVQSYNQDAGDWFWAKYKADGSIEKEGKVAGCIGCHSAVINNDWIFTGPVK